jgi:hypothetical protein
LAISGTALRSELGSFDRAGVFFDLVFFVVEVFAAEALVLLSEVLVRSDLLPRVFVIVDASSVGLGLGVVGPAFGLSAVCDACDSWAARAFLVRFPITSVTITSAKSPGFS